MSEHNYNAMNGEQKTWVCIVGVIALVVASAIVVASVRETSYNRAVASLVKAGAEPLEAVCALDPSKAAAMCQTLVSRGR